LGNPANIVSVGGDDGCRGYHRQYLFCISHTGPRDSGK
jgi:hypothetical protein